MFTLNLKKQIAVVLTLQHFFLSETATATGVTNAGDTTAASSGDATTPADNAATTIAAVATTGTVEATTEAAVTTASAETTAAGTGKKRKRSADYIPR